MSDYVFKIKEDGKYDIDQFWKDNDNWDLREVKKDINILVPMYLTCSFLYYHYPDLRPIATDQTFDMCCRMLLANWDDIEHMHKHLIDVESLKAGTGFNIKLEDYPSRVRNVALSMSYRRPVH